MVRVGWYTWAAGLAVVLMGLGWQIRYAADVLECKSGNLLNLCSGPMPDWLMPVTVMMGLVLVAVGALRLGWTQE